MIAIISIKKKKKKKDDGYLIKWIYDFYNIASWTVVGKAASTIIQVILTPYQDPSNTTSNLPRTKLSKRQFMKAFLNFSMLKRYLSAVKSDFPITACNRVSNLWKGEKLWSLTLQGSQNTHLLLWRPSMCQLFLHNPPSVKKTNISRREPCG